MDIVIPFVDCSDKVWMKNFLTYGHSENNKSQLKKINYCHYYNYDTLKYVFRGIDSFIPYTNNIFLIVSNIEQVPNYVDQSKVKIVLHKDFIPEKFLPVYQANTIEMFIHNINELDEEYLFIQDDIIPVSHISYDQLFKDGLPCISFLSNNLPQGTLIYRHINISFFEAINTVKCLTNKEINYTGPVLWPNHGPNPMLKSVCIEASSIKRHDQLLNFYVSTYRRDRNMNQYYWCYILYFLNKYAQSDINLKYTTTQDIDDIDINDIRTNYHYICINDFGSDTYTVSEIKHILKNKLDSILPNKCKYEI